MKTDVETLQGTMLSTGALFVPWTRKLAGVNPYTPPAAEEEEDERKGQGAKRLSLGLLGIGGAGVGLARGMATDDQVKGIRAAVDEYNPAAFTQYPGKGDDVAGGALPAGHTGHTYYEKYLARAAQLRPFGQDIGDILVPLRSSEKLMDSLRTPGYRLKTLTSREGAGGRPHYKSFSNGPVPAYAHQMGVKFRDVVVPPELLGGDSWSKYTARDPDYSTWMGRKLRDFINQKGEEVTGVNTGPMNPLEITTKLLSNEDQDALMTAFGKSLTPEEQRFRLAVEDPGAGYASQTANYLPKAKGYVDARDKIQRAGITTAGAGAGGMLGLGMYKLLKRKEDETRRGRWLSTLLGGGLGGAAAHFGGSATGRQSVLKLLQRMQGKKSA